MDGVPVKISEKYKPPPKVSIPQTIINRLNSDGYPPGIFKYDFTLEHNVIKSIEDWKRVRELEKVNRRSRLQQLEIEQAREIEQKQKQLLTSVSYPNADEISSGDEGESDSSTAATSTAAYNNSAINNTCKSPETLNQAFNQQTFNTILKPIVLPENAINISNNSTIWKTSIGNNLINGKINYSDFENDTSSPFDNVELKTINDLDILAQVYNISHSNNTENIQKEIDNKNSLKSYKILQNNVDIESTNVNQIVDKNISSNLKSDENNTSNIQNLPNPSTFWKNNNINPIVHNTLISQSIQNCEIPNTSLNHYYQLQQNYTNMNDSTNNHPQQFLLKSDNYYTQNYGNLSVNQNYQLSNLQSNLTSDNTNATNYMNYNNQINYNKYSPNYHLPTATSISSTVNYPSVGQNQIQPTKQSVQSITPTYANNITLKNLILEESAIQTKFKSKSVPDILKELDEEIKDSENRRARNHSQTIEDHSANYKEKIDKEGDKLPETLLKLSNSTQNLIKNISSMGFPIKRVAKIVEKLGTDDKKIFEHLIPLSELVDLGFDEEKISEALLLYDNNKDKALDYLIS